MRRITTNLYQYDELSDKAKEKARDWYLQGYDGEAEWEFIQEDAKEVGLKIIGLDSRRNNEGEFITTARECAEKILKNHGDMCETYTTARAFLKEYEALELDDDEYFVDSDKADSLVKDFLYSILEDFRILFEKDMEYNTSKEQVEESIRANEYEFTEDGERA